MHRTPLSSHPCVLQPLILHLPFPYLSGSYLRAHQGSSSQFSRSFISPPPQTSLQYLALSYFKWLYLIIRFQLSLVYRKRLLSDRAMPLLEPVHVSLSPTRQSQNSSACYIIIVNSNVGLSLCQAPFKATHTYTCDPHTTTSWVMYNYYVHFSNEETEAHIKVKIKWIV